MQYVIVDEFGQFTVVDDVHSAEVHDDRYYKKEAICWLPPIQTYDDLPLTGNYHGDSRLILADKNIYVWIETAGYDENGAPIFVGDWLPVIGNYWNEPVASFDDLPLTGNLNGEVRLIEDQNTLFRWNNTETEWVLIYGGGVATIREDYTVETGPGQTVFTLTNKYEPGGDHLRVYKNGLLMRRGASDDYIETDSQTVTFQYTVDPGDDVSFIIGDPLNSFFGAIDSFVVPTGPSQTVFNTSFTFNIGNQEIDVFKNGLLMLEGETNDYTETGNSQITFNEGAIAGDLAVIRKARDYTRTGGSINDLYDLDNLTKDLIPTDATGVPVDLGSAESPFANIRTDNLYIYAIKSGATQAAAGAAAGELWKTDGHDTLPDNVILIGV